MATNLSFWTYSPPQSVTPDTCWYPWGDHDGHTLHYCNVPGSYAQFTAPIGGLLHIVYKIGPDCGIFSIIDVTNERNDSNIEGGSQSPQIIDSYSPTVNWDAHITLTQIVSGHKYRVTVSNNKNPKSTNSWVQIVALDWFKN
eukprot:m.106165 g.106165  ORF g.106165 m.106165 type:complete len:142 (-) comp13897_c0_seq6:1106-1531(-)